MLSQCIRGWVAAVDFLCSQIGRMNQRICTKSGFFLYRARHILFHKMKKNVGRIAPAPQGAKYVRRSKPVTPACFAAR